METLVQQAKMADNKTKNSAVLILSAIIKYGLLLAMFLAPLARASAGPLVNYLSLPAAPPTSYYSNENIPIYGQYGTNSFTNFRYNICSSPGVNSQNQCNGPVRSVVLGNSTAPGGFFSFTASPLPAGIYYIQFSGDAGGGGADTYPVEFDVVQAPPTPPPIGTVTPVITITTDKSSVREGEDLTITWLAENATQCGTRNGPSGWYAVGMRWPISGTKTFTININSGTWSGDLRIGLQCSNTTYAYQYPNVYSFGPVAEQYTTVHVSAPSCTTSSQDQTLSCPAHQSGTIYQRRTSSCPDPYGSAVWGDWQTTANTCTQDPPTCSTSSQTQTLSCPAHQHGSITQTKTSSCPDPYGSPVWGGWSTTSDTCAWDAATCSTSSESRTLSCTSMFPGEHYSGALTQSRSTSCPDPYGSPVWGAWSPDENRSFCTKDPATCSTSSQNQTLSCPDLYSGSISQTKTSSCPDPYGSPVWPSDWQTASNTCKANTPSVKVWLGDNRATTEATIDYGGSIIIHWESTNATSCSAPGGGRDTSGSVAAGPTDIHTPTTYTVSCTNHGEVNTSSFPVYVTVNPPPPPTATLTVGGGSSATVEVEDSVDYLWSSKYADQFTSSYSSDTCGSGSWTANSNKGVSAEDIPYSSQGCNKTITYSATQTVTGKVASVSVAVRVNPLPLSAKFSKGDWAKATDKINVRATPEAAGSLLGTQSVGDLGTVSEGPTYKNKKWWWHVKFYRGQDGWTTEDNISNVPPPAPPVVTLAANHESIGYRLPESSTLTWNAVDPSGLATCHTPGGDNATHGTFSASPTQNTTYTVTCEGPGGNSSSPPITITVVPWPPPTVTLKADHESIGYQLLDSATLSWTSTDATTCDAPGGSHELSGSVTVYPNQNTNYSVTCTGRGGNGSSPTITITVVPWPAPTVTLKANAEQIDYGSTARLHWRATEATSCHTPNGVTDTEGDARVTLYQTTTFTVTCDGRGGNGSSPPITVSVIPPPAPSASLTVGKSSRTMGKEINAESEDNLVFSWSSQYADQFKGTYTSDNCGSGDWSLANTEHGDGSYSIPINYGNCRVRFIFTVRQSGTNEVASDSVAVSVNRPPAPEVTFSSDRNRIDLGGSATLTWSSTNAVSCNAPGGLKDTAGSVVVSPTEETTYALTCTGPGGDTSSAPVSIGVNQPPPPPALIAPTLTPTPTTETAPTTPTTQPATQTAPTEVTQPAPATQTTPPVETSPPPTETTPPPTPATQPGTQTTSQTTTQTQTTVTPLGPSTFQVPVTEQTQSIFNLLRSRLNNITNSITQPTQNLIAPVVEEEVRTPTLTIGITGANVGNLLSKGTPVTVQWSSQYADSCQAAGDWSGTKSTSGSENVGPVNRNSSYALICQGKGGNVARSVYVRIKGSPPGIDLYPERVAVPSGSRATLIWSVTDATFCRASDGWSGSRYPDGRESVGPIKSETTFTLSCSGPSGESEKSVTVFVTKPVAAPSPTATTPARTSATPTIKKIPVESVNLNILNIPSPLNPSVTLSASPTSVKKGEGTTLTWSAKNVTQCSARGGLSSVWFGTKLLSGKVTISPITDTTTYSLLCSGSKGSAGKSVTVTVTP